MQHLLRQMEELLSCHGRLKFQHLDLDRKCSYFNSQEQNPPDINKYYARTLTFGILDF